MGLNLPLKIQAVVTLVDPHTLRCEIDITKVPSIKLAIAMLEQTARELRTEEMNQASVLFGQRMMKEQMEQGIAAAVANQRKQ